ncbi:MAG: hypothetical protein GQ565_03660 [Candidatus Aegiribacteria sp.]|nr:hypothetical protein [Candidatus Aegiribacteria sp.]
MKNKANKGTALIIVLIAAIVLSILVGALYTLFQSNTRSQAWAKERIQARFTAEAGTNLSIYMIMEGADVPQGTDPIKFLPETGNWHDLGSEMGWVLVYVDPHDKNAEIASANAYEVRCLSKVLSEDQTHMYGIASLILPRNFAVFATFLNQAGGGYYGDNYRFDGPFHSNEVPWLSSATPDGVNDLWVYSMSVAADHYLYYNPSTGGLENATTPHHKNLYIQPYEKMLMGEPYFALDVDPIPFGSDEVNWEGAFNAANSGGLVLNGLDNFTRMILLDSLLLVKQSNIADVDTFDLSSYANPVVWVNNGDTETVYLKTDEELNFRNHGLSGLPDGLTIGVNGNLSVSGPILYGNIDLMDEDNTTLLGLIVKEGDFTVALDPDITGMTEWGDETWEIKTSHHDYDGIEIDAVFMVLEGNFELEDGTNTHWPSPAIDLEIVGGYIVENEGITTWSYSGQTWGYWTFVTYDPRLMTMHPPYFPQTGVWDTGYWDERPDMHDVADPNDPNWIGQNGV